MSLDKLISYIGKDNIADKFTKDVLRNLARQVINDHERDESSMQEWKTGIEDGIKISKPDINTKNEPWPGASNFKSLAISEASISFTQRTTTELLRTDKIIKAKLVGESNEAKRKAGERVAKHMNHQFVKTKWRKEQKQVIASLSPFGTVFKDTYFDPITQANKSDIIRYPDFSVNQKTKGDQDTFTMLKAFSRNEIFERKAAGVWSEDVDIYPEVDKSVVDAKEGSDSEQDVDKTEDNPERFLVQNCFYSFHDDDDDKEGYAAPFRVTVHEATSTVVRVIARYELQDIFVHDGNKVRRIESRETASDEPDANEPTADLKLVRVDPCATITKYQFINDPNGLYLGIGYYHLLTPMVQANNAITNSLVNAGKLANTKGGFTARGWRRRAGQLKMKMGEYVETQLSAQDLQTGIRDHTFGEPSQVLFMLGQMFDEKIQSASLKIDLKGTLAPNAPATTTLALMQEQLLPLSAIMQNIIDSQDEEFQIHFRLNGLFGDEQEYQNIFDDQQLQPGQMAQDYNPDSMDIEPTANAEMSSKMQRLQIAETLVSRALEITQEGGDARVIWEFWVDAVGVPELKGQIFPDPNQLTEQQKARQAEKEQQAAQAAQLLEIEIDHKEREIKTKEEEAQSKILVNEMTIEKLFSETVLNYEKAESEDVKNNINTYTSRLDAIKLEVESNVKVRDLRQREQQSARELSEKNRAVPGK